MWGDEIGSRLTQLPNLPLEPGREKDQHLSLVIPKFPNTVIQILPE